MSEQDWSHVHSRVHEAISLITEAWTLPSVLYRPKVFLDGTMWCCLLGDNIQEGVVAYGKTPYEAVSNFDHYAWYGKNPGGQR